MLQYFKSRQFYKKDNTMAVGHRQRIREKIEECGLAALHDHELLEYILFSFIPRKDTSTLARTLLNDFGDLQGVMSATFLELKHYKGMTDAAAQFIPLIPQFYSRAVSKRLLTNGTAVSPHTIVRYLYAQLAHLKHERIIFIAIDKHSRFLRAKGVDGGTDSADFTMSQVAEFAISSKASTMVIGHNHPMSNEIPSKKDLKATADIYYCLDGIGVNLVDHIIIAGEQYFSFREKDVVIDERLATKSIPEIIGDNYTTCEIKEKTFSNLIGEIGG